MNSADPSQRTIQALQERLARLTEASLLINASLDLDEVLRQVAENARVLTGARYAFIVSVDADGPPREFVYSGITEEDFQRMNAWPDAMRLFEHLRGLPDPVRIDDITAYIGELGFAPHPIPEKAFYCTALGHRGRQVGYFFLGGKEGGRAFTDEDEEILVAFASQAAAAIANARTFRKEQRARADLEALVDTSPVGVVVFDGKTGRPVSVNREARRIVECLRDPGQSIEQLLEVVTSRRSDGREMSFREIPTSRQLSQNRDTLRAMEMEFSVPDGRSIAALVNATPIFAADGSIESAVATMQDLGPLQEIERLRAQFVGMVSQELRAPLTSIKGSAAALLDSAAALDPDERREYARIIDEQADRMRDLISELLDAARIETGTLSVRPESWDVAALVERARHGFLRGGSPHSVLVDLPPDLPRVMAERRRIVQVLNNLFANAARNAPPSSPIRVSALRDGTHVAVSVTDEGQGVPPERLPHLFRKYTGTAKGKLGGGLGLAICKGLVEAHGGRIWAESAGPRQGARFTFTLPAAEETAASPGRKTAQGKEGIQGTVLMAGDDPPTLRYVRDALVEAGYRPVVTGDHRALGQLIRTEAPRLVLLDLLGPGSGGIELMGQVPELAEVPVIVLSGYGGDETIAKALASGAADYIAKPFSATELTARIGAALRKRAEPEPFVLGELAIRYDRRRVSVAGQPVDLTATEYELLRVLSLGAGRVVTFDSLIRQVWHGRKHGNQKLVRAFIRSLRSKLGDDAAAPAYIFSERGVGYRMGDPR